MKDTQPTTVGKPSSSKGRVRLFAVLGLILILALGILGGYGSGVIQRLNYEKTVIAGQLDDQYRRGVEALESGYYERAQEHFNFVYANEPGYPGLQESMVELARRISISPTPTLTLTPTITPTPDLREVEAIFSSATQALNAGDWTGAIASLDSLRRRDPAYRAIEIDGMYYIALRNRGVANILPPSCQDTNLEAGIYDLTLAERFGPLDSYADALRSNARRYLSAASYWELDWNSAQLLFGQVAASVPNMMDPTCLTAQERYRIASLEYAEQLSAAGQYCDSIAFYDQGLLISSAQNEPYFAVREQVYILCYGTPVPPTPIPTATLSETPTP
ncbi:MAG: hypothetical protein JXB85_02780 [Anaerolineales bacterium]|nr:hypothetical protein [Anaerolineales bacterium]